MYLTIGYAHNINTAFCNLSVLFSERLSLAWQFLFSEWQLSNHSLTVTCSEMFLMTFPFFFFIKPFFLHETRLLLFIYCRQWTCKHRTYRPCKPPQWAKDKLWWNLISHSISFIVFPEVKLIPIGRHKCNAHLKEPAGWLAL